MNKANIKPRKDGDGTSVEEEGVGVGGGKEYTEEELDLLQAKWVIGKMRGQTLPIVMSELAQLVDTGRVGWDTLAKEEKRKLKRIGVWRPQFNKQKGGDKQNPNEVVVQKESGKLARDVYLMALSKLVEKVLLEKYKYCSREEWDKKSPELKRAVLRLFAYVWLGRSGDVIDSGVQSGGLA